MLLSWKCTQYTVPRGLDFFTASEHHCGSATWRGVSGSKRRAAGEAAHLARPPGIGAQLGPHQV